MPDAAVNSQITDSVTQANTKVLGDAPAIAMGNLFVATSQALANAAHNATNNQQQTYVTAQAAATQAVATMLSVDTAVTGVAAEKALGKPVASAAVATAAARTDATGAPLQASSPAPGPALNQDLSGAAFAAAKASTDPMLSLMVLDAGALAILDAVAHLQRTAIVTETANALALTRALAEPQDNLWQEVLQASNRSLEQATEHLGAVARLAIALTHEARGS